MSTRKDTPAEPLGIPIAQRSEDQIRAAFKSEDPSVTLEFVRLWQYMRDKNVGLTKSERGFKISSGILSQCFNNKYPGVRAEIAERINAVFYRMEQNARYESLSKFVPTQLSQVLCGIYEKTRITRRIQVIQGPEQCGKTRAAKHCRDENNHGRTRYTELRASLATLNDFIHNLAHDLGAGTSLKLRDKKFYIRDTLIDCDLLIIDEAHLVFKWPTAQISAFFDYVRTDIFSNGERGVILQATDDREIGEFMDGVSKLCRQTRYNIGQLIGRMGLRPYILDGTDDIPEEDIALLVGRYYKAGKDTLRRLAKMAHAERGGRLGRVLECVSNAWTKSKARKRDLTDAMVNEEIEAVEVELKKSPLID